MKTTKYLLIILSVFLFSVSYAAVEPEFSPKVLRARKAVEKTASDDWKTLAKSARICIEQGENLEEASAWLDRSLALHECSESWEAKGDYFYRMGNAEQAVRSYTESVACAVHAYPNTDIESVQLKILVLLKPQLKNKCAVVFKKLRCQESGKQK